MEDDMRKVNLLTIVVAGLLIMLTGLVLFLFRDNISKNGRFFLPILPIGVAAYVFVFNMFGYYKGNLPDGLLHPL